ncbi:MAG: peptidoglycan editing factor PgeF [Congregibacter sp.]
MPDSESEHISGLDSVASFADQTVPQNDKTPQLLTPLLANWPKNVRLYSSTRGNGLSQAPYAAFNLAQHVGDDPQTVEANRALLHQQLPAGTTVAWLAQTHGTRVVLADSALGNTPEADASWTPTAGVACAIMTADCLPILITDATGSLVAAVHAGWRGLVAGIVENTLALLPAQAPSLRVWLGPAISAQAFEVGAEVRDTFLAVNDDPANAACFRPSARGSQHYYADLRGLARLRLQRLGVSSIFSDDACTFGDSERFFSHRRHAPTGRMASLIVRLPAQ